MSAWKCSFAYTLLQRNFSIICITFCASTLHKLEWGLTLTYMVLKLATWPVLSSETHWHLSSCFFITKFFTGCSASQSWWAVLFSFCYLLFTKKFFIFYVSKYFKLTILKMFKFKYKFWHSMLTYYGVMFVSSFLLCNYLKETLFLEWCAQWNKIWLLHIQPYQIWIWFKLKSNL